MKQWGIPKPSEYLSPEEIRVIIQGAVRERDRLFLETLWQSAARLQEVLALTPEWIGENSLILPNLKQRVSRGSMKEPVVSKELCMMLKLWVRSNKIPEGCPVFGGNRNPRKKLEASYAWRLVTRISGNAGIFRKKKDKRGKVGFRPAWVHLFRHSSAMYLLDRSSSTELVQYQLGHSSIITTQAYARIQELKAKERLMSIWEGK